MNIDLSWRQSTPATRSVCIVTVTHSMQFCFRLSLSISHLQCRLCLTRPDGHYDARARACDLTMFHMCCCCCAAATTIHPINLAVDIETPKPADGRIIRGCLIDDQSSQQLREASIYLCNENGCNFASSHVPATALFAALPLLLAARNLF